MSELGARERSRHFGGTPTSKTRAHNEGLTLAERPADSRARTTLAELLDEFGSTLIDGVIEASSLQDPVQGVAIYDSGEGFAAQRGDLLLAVGVRETEEIVNLLRQLSAVGGVGLVVKGLPANDLELASAVKASGIALLAVNRGTPWIEIISVLRSSLGRDEAGHVPGLEADALSGDLFALANAISALLDVPVTIEDRSSRVLAFSDRQQEADSGRVETVLGRQVPERYTRILEEHGVFRTLYRSSGTVYVDQLGEGMKPRVAVAVRAGDELLGSMWAAVPGPLSPERDLAFRESAELVAMHLVRQRARADIGRRVRAELVATVLDGRREATDAAKRLRIGTGPAQVLAAHALGQRDDSRSGVAMERLNNALSIHLAALHPLAATVLIGDVVYAVLPGVDPDCESNNRGVAAARNFLARTGDRDDIVVAVGGVANSFRELPRSRREADRALRVLSVTGSAPGRRVVRLSDVWLESLLLRIADMTADDGDQDLGPIAALRAYDAEHHTDMVGSLRAHLDAMGNTNLAAERMHVHPNTFRYRLKRLREISGLDVDDPDARLAAALQLRLATLVDG